MITSSARHRGSRPTALETTRLANRESGGGRQRRKREEKRCVSLNSPLVAGTMSVSVRRFLQRRAEASSGAAAFAAGDASSPRASVPGDAARFSPGTAGGRFGAESAGSPGDDSASPERTTRLDYYPDDIVPTPRHGDDTSGDEGVHPNDDPSSPTWHAAPHRSPLAFSFRGHSSSNAATKRPPANPRAGGMVVAPGPHADVLPRRRPRALRFEGDVDPASARRRLRRQKNPEQTKPGFAAGPRGFARDHSPSTARVSSWASPERAKRALARPAGPKWGAPDRETFSQAMRDAETVETRVGAVAGARARARVLAALAGDVALDVFDAVTPCVDDVAESGHRNPKRAAKVTNARFEPGEERKRAAGASRRVAFFRHACAPAVSAARECGWLAGHASPAIARREALPRRFLRDRDRGDRDRDRFSSSDRRNRDQCVDAPATESAAWFAARAAAAAFGSERRARAAIAARDALARANGGLGRVALDAESLYAEIHSCVSTKTPRRAILAGDADPGHGRFAVARATRHET